MSTLYIYLFSFIFFSFFIHVFIYFSVLSSFAKNPSFIHKEKFLFYSACLLENKISADTRCSGKQSVTFNEFWRYRRLRFI